MKNASWMQTQDWARQAAALATLRSQPFVFSRR